MFRILQSLLNLHIRICFILTDVCVWGGVKVPQVTVTRGGRGAIKALIITIGKTLMIKGGGVYNECGI